MTVQLWRIASDAPQWTADEMAGKAAASRGSRWNHPGEPLLYATTSVALAAWETRAHFGQGAGRLPRNRFLVRVDVPDPVWAVRQVLTRPPAVGWNAIPEGLASRNLGSIWLRSVASVLLAVPSVIIDDEDNILINPAHPDASLVTAVKVRRFVYDHRV